MTSKKLKRVESVPDQTRKLIAAENPTLEGIKNIPKTVALDHALVTAKIVWSAVPVMGGPISEILGKIVGTVVSTRVGKWYDYLVQGFV